MSASVSVGGGLSTITLCRLVLVVVLVCVFTFCVPVCLSVVDAVAIRLTSPAVPPSGVAPGVRVRRARLLRLARAVRPRAAAAVTRARGTLSGAHCRYIIRSLRSKRSRLFRLPLQFCLSCLIHLYLSVVHSQQH